MKSAAVILGVLLVALIGVGAYVRLAPSDPARWNTDPAQGAAGRNSHVAKVFVPLPPAEALAAFDRVALAEPRTVRLAGSVGEGRITYVSRSRLWGFPDYTTVAAVPDEGGAWLVIHARARFGDSDLGVNAARVGRWVAALRQRSGGQRRAGLPFPGRKRRRDAMPLARFARCLTIAAALAAPLGPALACTRAVYLGPEDRVLTGRTFDWRDPIVSNLWVFPRGMARDGEAGPRSVEWTSRYGSLIVSGYDVSTVDGMNEAGLVANLLWLVDAEYPEDDGMTPRISVSVWAQYFLDNFATVAEAVEHLAANPLDAATGDVPGQPGRLTTVHLSLSDATGDSAILEWIDGELMVHHSRDYRVMTNEPRFEEQLAITRYWDRIDPLEFLPGTNRAADRFVRARFYIDTVLQSDDPRVAAAAVFSVIRNASVPYGISVADAPNLSTTRWRVVADQKERLFYVESALSPNVFWVDLARLDFTEGASVRKLDLGVDMAAVHSGEASDDFFEAEPFAFEPAP